MTAALGIPQINYVLISREMDIILMKAADSIINLFLDNLA
jgi:hypothetical protein